MKKRLDGFQKRIKSAPTREVGLAVMTLGEAAGRTFAGCSCGWVTYHQREKVLNSRAGKHVDEKHNGRGIWL